MKSLKYQLRCFFSVGFAMLMAAWIPSMCFSQVNSGSNGSDGAFNPTTNTIVDMADHPNGIYQYTSVNIPYTVLVTFTPNANNTPVVWLVQSNCTINGYVSLSGQTGSGAGGLGGPGGFRGGDGGDSPTPGQGPGGGLTSLTNCYGGNASYGTMGGIDTNCTPSQQLPGQVYGNAFLIPLLGGSGGGGARRNGGIGGGGGGGGAMLIAASGTIEINGTLESKGGYGFGCTSQVGGNGSGGGVRLVATILLGNGTINTSGGHALYCPPVAAGDGRVRLDGLDIHFTGIIYGESSRGYQPIIIPTTGQGAQLSITSIGGVPVPASPTGTIATPDAVLSAQQNNPISVVVHCSNIPLNTQITVSVKPANAAPVSATGLNTTGTTASSTANVSINMPRGGGIIYATASTSN